MNHPTITQTLEECVKQFRDARGSVVKAMPLLYEIWEKELWSVKYSSLSEFLDECGISRSQASRLITVYARFKDVPELESVDPERLYLAAKLDGTPQEQFEKARVLTRNEIRETLATKEDGSEHDHLPRLFCSVCWKPMDSQ